MQQVLERVDALIYRGEVKKAEVLIAKTMRSEISADEQAHLLICRARVRLLSARPEDALDDLSAASALQGERFKAPQNYELLADCYLARFELATVGFADKNFLAQAQETYRHIIDAFPRYANLGWVYYQLGRISMASNQIEQAVELFQQALLHPSHVNTLTAYCYERLGFIAFYEWRDMEKSLGFLNRAVDTYPAAEDRNWLVQVHLRRSRVLRQMRDYETALKAAETALTLVSAGGAETRSALAETQITIAELLNNIGQRDKEIIACLQQFTVSAKKPLGVDVTWSRAHEMLGDAYFNLGQFDNAVLSYRAALQFNPDHPWELSLLYRIARSYYQQRAYQDVVETIHHMLDAARADDQTVDDYRVYDMLGGALFALGRYDEAVGAYRRALEMSPPHTDVEKIKTYLDYALEQS